MPPSVFLSHSTQDRETVDRIRDALQHNGVECWIAPDNILHGETWPQAITRGIGSSKVVLCVLSESANKSEEVAREICLAGDKRKILIPMRIEDVRPSEGLAFYFTNVQWLDAFTPPIDRHLWTIVDRVKEVLKSVPQETAPEPPRPPAPSGRPVLHTGKFADFRPNGGRASEKRPTSARAQAPSSVAELDVRQAVRPQKVALLYKRNAKPDDHVLALLESGLGAAGHSVFVDRHMSIGLEWVGEIERQVREADAVVPLLSASSVYSEMLGWEMKTASNAAQLQSGKPRILPVRVGSEDALPEPFDSILGRLQYKLWSNADDDQALLDSVLDGLDSKESPKPKPPGGAEGDGAVPLDSRYYIIQPTDIEFYEGLERQDGLLLVKGARQMGKTSLLARGLQQAREAGKTVVSLDLQSLNQEDLKDITSLYKALGGLIAGKLKLDVYPEDKWRPQRGANANFENYIIREVMDKIEGHIVIAMDEVDRLFFFDYASEVFGMFRSWFNARTTDPTLPWDRLTQAFVYATEPHLFITNQFVSPFNVGTKIEMKDFNLEQVTHLNELHGRPLHADDELKRFHALFEGQPYLSRRGFRELTRTPSPLTFDQLVAEADMDEGPFGDHLRRILVMVATDKRTLEVITGMIHGQPIPDQMAFYNLRSGGLISGHTPEDARFRCSIYETYLKRHLDHA
jgi:hypothetical protein